MDDDFEIVDNYFSSENTSNLKDNHIKTNFQSKYYEDFQIHKMNIDRIAIMYSVKRSTIISHLINALEQGNVLDCDRIKEFPSPDMRNVIIKIRNEIGGYYLRPIKEKLPDVSYDTIKLALAFFNRIDLEQDNSVKIYVLELEQGKIYVGKTTDLDNRLNSHFFESGSVFTKQYKPTGKVLDNLSTIDGVSRIRERDETLMQMWKYGINNVRGAGWVKSELSDYAKLNIISALCKKYNLCQGKCKKDYHLQILTHHEKTGNFLFVPQKKKRGFTEWIDVSSKKYHTYFEVPFHDKKLAKDLGAKWDNVAKKWYSPNKKVKQALAQYKWKKLGKIVYKNNCIIMSDSEDEN